MGTPLQLASKATRETGLPDLFADPARLDRDMRAVCRRLPDFDCVSALRWLMIMRALGREEYVRDLVEGQLPENVLVPHVDAARQWRTEDLARETERQLRPAPHAG